MNILLKRPQAQQKKNQQTTRPLHSLLELWNTRRSPHEKSPCFSPKSKQNKQDYDQNRVSWMFRKKENSSHLKKLSNLSETACSSYLHDASVNEKSYFSNQKEKVGSLIIYEKGNSTILPQTRILNHPSSKTNPLTSPNTKRLGFGCLSDLENKRFQIFKKNQPGPNSYFLENNTVHNKTVKRRKVKDFEKYSNVQEKVKVQIPGPGAYFFVNNKENIGKKKLRELWAIKKQQQNQMKKLLHSNISNKHKLQQFIKDDTIKQETVSSSPKKLPGFTFPKSNQSTHPPKLERKQLQSTTQHFLKKQTNIFSQNCLSSTEQTKKFKGLQQKMFSNCFLMKNDHAFEGYLNHNAMKDPSLQSEYVYIPGKIYPKMERQSPQFKSKTLRKFM